MNSCIALDASDEFAQGSAPAMRLFSRIITLLLLTIWLPATQHCNLEAAGLIAKYCSDRSLPVPSDSDDCSLVENGVYKAGTDFVKVSAPGWSVCDLLLSVGRLSLAECQEPPIGFLESAGAGPLEWVATWQFARRAAPPCRAPSRLFA